MNSKEGNQPDDLELILAISETDLTKDSALRLAKVLELKYGLKMRIVGRRKLLELGEKPFTPQILLMRRGEIVERYVGVPLNYRILQKEIETDIDRLRGG